MRFVSYILFASLILSGSPTLAAAQNSNIPITDYTDLTLAPSSPAARLQKGQRVNKLETLEGLKFKRFARRLGQISSIALGSGGQLYTTDTQSGRVFVIPQPDKNSRGGQIRPLPYRFNAPSSVIELGNNLYISDQDAIWKMPINRISGQQVLGQAAPANAHSDPSPIPLASLKNTQSTGPYFLAARRSTSNDATGNDATGNDTTGKALAPKTPESLILGYTTDSGKARLISVDTITGAAQLIDETNGEITQLVTAPSGTKPWAAYRNQDGLHIGTNFDNAVNLGPSLSINGIALPQSNSVAGDWPKSLRNHIYISKANPVSVSALPTSLGLVLPRGRDVFTGFQNGRTAWGKAGALHMDTRGLFIADPYNGDLWLVQPKGKASKTIPKDSLNIALEKVRATESREAAPLTRNPLDGIYDSLFPDPNAPESKVDPNSIEGQLKGPRPQTSARAGLNATSPQTPAASLDTSNSKASDPDLPNPPNPLP